MDDSQAFDLMNEGGEKIDFTDKSLGLDAEDLLIRLLLDKYDVPIKEQGKYLNNLYDFSRIVRLIESDDDPSREAKDLSGSKYSAKGVYQFTDATVRTTRRKALMLGVPQGRLDEMSFDPRQWTDQEADLMFFANLLTKTGSDWYLLEVGKGNNKLAGIEAYYDFHHTDPDRKTKERAEEKFNVRPIMKRDLEKLRH